MTAIIYFIKLIMLAVLSILPDSPFQTAFADMDLSYLPTLNWFIPLDTCATVVTAWLACLLAYITFKLVYKLLLQKIISAAASGSLKSFLK